MYNKFSNAILGYPEQGGISQTPPSGGFPPGGKPQPQPNLMNATRPQTSPKPPMIHKQATQGFSFPGGASRVFSASKNFKPTKFNYSISSTPQLYRALRTGLLGAAGGSLLGAGQQYLNSDANTTLSDYLASAAKGAVLPGLVGAGLGYAHTPEIERKIGLSGLQHHDLPAPVNHLQNQSILKSPILEKANLPLNKMASDFPALATALATFFGANSTQDQLAKMFFKTR